MLRLGLGLDLPAGGATASGGGVVVEPAGNLLFDGITPLLWDDGITPLLWDSATPVTGSLFWDDGTTPLLWHDGATSLIA